MLAALQEGRHASVGAGLGVERDHSPVPPHGPQPAEPAGAASSSHAAQR